MFKKHQCIFRCCGNIVSEFRLAYSKRGVIAIEDNDGNTVAKRCTRCEKYRRIVHFRKAERQGFKGYFSSCNDCEKKRQSEWKKMNPERVKKQKRKDRFKANKSGVLVNLIKKEIKKNIENYEGFPTEVQLELKYDNETKRIILNTNELLNLDVEK